MIALHVRTYERDTLVLEHTFFGETREKARAMLAAHMGTDAFLRAALNTGAYNGIPLRNELWWTTTR